ncbi:hypothetical protein R1sor_004937 [Riccia sorocarpa]|uniref:Dynein regulatory complex subunit 2 n=1 Tax=Riccia sorocarpa TaxID=122646 RepID=A0ABD3HMF4_9MARC
MTVAMDRKKKVKRELTEEEKQAKAELKAIKAEEQRKKKILTKRENLLQGMSVEALVTKNNNFKVHTQWRELMRQGKVEELRKSLDPIMEKYDNDIKKADKTIEHFRNRLDEADDQYEFAHNNHMQTVNTLIDLHHTRVQIMENDFLKHLKRLENEFNTERQYIINMQNTNEQELVGMMKAMEEEFKEAMNDQRQQFETIREELKNKSTEEYNVAKLGLESQVEDLENQIQETHKTYLANTEAKTIQFKTMVKKDVVTSRLVEQRMRKLIRLHEALAYWRARITVNTREWEAMNKALRDEKDRINKHYQDLKRSLNRLHVAEHTKLRAISKASGEVMENLKEKLILAERILSLGALNKKLETEYDRIYPHLISNDGEHPPKQKISFLTQNEKPLPDEDYDRANPERMLRFTTFALDDYGEEVTEERYFENLNRRFNKVMLERMAINLERKRLKEVNSNLQKRLGHYLEMSPMIKQKLKAANFVIDFGGESTPPQPSRSH